MISYEAIFLKQIAVLAWKKNQASTGFKPMTLALPVRCSTNRAMKPSTLGVR